MPQKVKDYFLHILTAILIVGAILGGVARMFSDVNKRLDAIELKTDLIKSEEDLKRIAYSEAKNFHIDLLKLKN